MIASGNTQAVNIGTIRNALGLLTEDHTGLIPSKFLEVTRLGPVDAERATGAKRAGFYRKSIALRPLSKLTEKVTQLVVASDLAYELLEESVDATAKWLMSPNALLFGKTPFEVCMQGDGPLLIEWLIDRLGIESPLLREEKSGNGKKRA